MTRSMSATLPYTAAPFPLKRGGWEGIAASSGAGIGASS